MLPGSAAHNRSLTVAAVITVSLTAANTWHSLHVHVLLQYIM